jgi:UDP-N-acetylmuramyl pentapeptide synthase
MLDALRLSDLLKPLAATLNGVDTHFDSVSIDARKVARGGLFVALPGSRSNGHDCRVADASQGANSAATGGAPRLVWRDPLEISGPGSDCPREKFPTLYSV